MKLYLSFCLLAVLIGCKTQPTRQQNEVKKTDVYEPIADARKKCLIIAIGDYDKSTGWNRINSVNDIGLIESALRRQGFSSFLIYQDSQATREGIDQAFKTFKNNLEPEDIVCIHISSHGQQLEDLNKDEADGLDEAIAAYDAPAYQPNGYKGEHHFKDDDFGLELEEIRKILGPEGDVLVLLDACFSGTGTRGQGSFRGGKAPLVSKNFKFANEQDQTMGVAPIKSRGNTQSNSASLVVISASRADQKNKEYKDSCGSLSLAFHKACMGITRNSTYRSLFANVMLEMSAMVKHQTPTLEGDVDKELFGGDVVEQHAFYTFNSISETWAVLDGGYLSGVEEGSEIEVYPSGTLKADSNKLVCKGRIVYSSAFNANVDLSQALDKRKLHEYWVFIKKKQFRKLKAVVSLQGLKSEGLKQKVIKEYETSELISIRNSDAVFNLVQNETKIDVVWSDDLSMFHSGINADSLEELTTLITQYLQGQFLKWMRFDHPDYNMRMNLIPLRAHKENRKWFIDDTLNIKDFLSNGLIELPKNKQKAILQLTNNSDVELYYNIVHIDHKGSISLLIPKKKRNGGWYEYSVKPNDSAVVPLMLSFTEESKGNETLKLFASSEPINFGPIFMGVAHRGSLNTEMERLFSHSYAMSRGEQSPIIDTETKATTSSLIFRVVP